MRYNINKSYNDLNHILIIKYDSLTFHQVTSLSRIRCDFMLKFKFRGNYFPRALSYYNKKVTNLWLDMFPDHRFSAMVNNNITRTAKQLTATLVNVFADSWLLSSQSFKTEGANVHSVHFFMSTSWFWTKWVDKVDIKTYIFFRKKRKCDINLSKNMLKYVLLSS